MNITINSKTIEKTLVFHNDSVEIYYYRSLKLIVQKWSDQKINLASFKSAIDNTLSLFKDNDVIRLLSDTSIQPMMNPEGTNYAASLIPKLLERGLKKMAFVMSDDVLTKLGVRNFSAAVDAPLVAHFNNIEDSLQWLLKN